MIISLCSGYGGLDRAVAAAFRMPIAAHAEPLKVRLRKDGPLVENPVTRVLERRFPGVPNIGDITAAGWSPWRGLCRVLCAGFPCQPVSAAGRQLAEDDERWLWPSVHRAVLELAPEWVVLENVANIVSIKGSAIWRHIIGQLQAAGYGVAWGVFGACLVGACHHRHRMFLVARRGAAGALRWPGKACGVPRGHVPPTPVARDAGTRGEGSPDYWAAKRAEGWTGGAPLGAELALLPTPQAREGDASRRTLPNAALAGVRWASGRRNLDDGIALLPTPTAQSYGSNQGGAAGRVGPVRHSLDALARLALLPTPRATDGTNGGPGQRGSSGDLAMPSAVQPEHWGRFAAAVARHADLFGTPPAPTEVGPKGGVRMAAPFPEWMMGLAPGYVTDLLPHNDALRAIGNGVMPQQGYYAIGELLRLLA